MHADNLSRVTDHHVMRFPLILRVCNSRRCESILYVCKYRMGTFWLHVWVGISYIILKYVFFSIH